MHINKLITLITLLIYPLLATSERNVFVLPTDDASDDQEDYTESFSHPPIDDNIDERRIRMHNLLHPPSTRELTRERNIYDNRFNTNENFQSTQPQFYNNLPDNPPPPRPVKQRKRGIIRAASVRGRLGRPQAPLPLYYSPINDPYRGPTDPFFHTTRLEANTPNHSLYSPLNPDAYYLNTNLPYPAPKRVSQADLIARLTRRNLRIFYNMDSQGQELAISFASEEDYDANSAVEEAARRMAIFRASEGESE